MFAPRISNARGDAATSDATRKVALQPSTSLASPKSDELRNSSEAPCHAWNLSKIRLSEYPHQAAIARAFGVESFAAPAAIDPGVGRLGAEAATEAEQVRFARWPSIEVAAHEAAHVVQSRYAGRRTDAAGAERHASAVANRIARGLGAADLVAPGALVTAAAPQPQLFVPAGAAPATHTVIAGETLDDIARQVYGDARYAAAIRIANPGKVTLGAGGAAVVTAGTVLSLPDHPDPDDVWVNPYVFPLLRNGGVWTPAQAEAALRAFAAESATRRDAMLAHYLPFNNIQTMLAALPVNSTQAGGVFETQARDLLQRIERVGARTEAATQGLVDEAAMAHAQANEMTARNRAAATAALPPGAPPPTTGQIAAQQRSQVAQGSIPPQTAVMSPAREATINTTLNTVSIPAFVTWATANHPQLGITAAHLRADARAIFDRGASIIAFADGTQLRAVVGEAFMQMVAANPAYALPTIVHEIWGHNTYEGRGNYGSPGASYGLDLYDKSAALMPGYVRPIGAGRTSEIDNYAYHETEMYSLMREVPFYTPNAPAHAALAGLNYDPAPEIKSRIKSIKDAFEARVARSLLRGLFLRFIADPTVGGPAMAAFRLGVTSLFPAADAAAILK
jgi:phage tail protein X